MTTRSIGEMVAPIIADAVGLARLQEFIGCVESPSLKKQLVMSWWEAGVISGAEAELLLDHNSLEAA